MAKLEHSDVAGVNVTHVIEHPQHGRALADDYQLETFIAAGWRDVGTRTDVDAAEAKAAEAEAKPVKAKAAKAEPKGQ